MIFFQDVERGFFLYYNAAKVAMKILFENQLLFSLDLIFKGFSCKVFFAWIGAGARLISIYSFE